MTDQQANHRSFGAPVGTIGTWLEKKAAFKKISILNECSVSRPLGLEPLVVGLGGIFYD